MSLKELKISIRIDPKKVTKLWSEIEEVIKKYGVQENHYLHRTKPIGDNK